MKARSPLLAFVGLGLLVSACQTHQVATAEDTSDAIRALGHRTNSDAYVVFDAQPSGQYIQFFNGGGAVYFDVSIQSASRRGMPEVLRLGEVQEAPPSLPGEVVSHRLISSEQAERLRKVLRRYGLADAPAYQVAFAPDSTLGGWFEIIRGRYTLNPDQTLTFLRDVFGEAYGLEDYTIRMETN